MYSTTKPGYVYAYYYKISAVCLFEVPAATFVQGRCDVNQINRF